MAHIIHTQTDLETALVALIESDPRLEPVFAKAGMPAIRRREGGYAGLCAIVCGQQLSTASAAAIRGRLMAAFDPFHHDAVRLARTDKLKRLGLSRPKIKSIKAIATAVGPTRHLSCKTDVECSKNATRTNTLAIRRSKIVQSGEVSHKKGFTLAIWSW
jgi:3-methyladenine DNA glycosylase/8-oxoguanine DNA glycosylase